MTDFRLPYDDLLRIARAVQLDVGRVDRTLQGEACRAVTEAQAARVRGLAAELRSRAPASRRVRRAEPGEVRL